MEKDSLGLIETLGLVGAIEAADAGSKAANVFFRGYERGRAGLITVVFTGDVAAVRAAVSAGAAAAKRVGQVVSIHVIARPDLQLHVTPNGSRSVAQEAWVTPEMAEPPAQPKVTVTEQTAGVTEQLLPRACGGIIEPSPEENAAAGVAAPNDSVVAVAEVEEPTSLERGQEQLDRAWPETKPEGGNGHSPTTKGKHLEEAAIVEPMATMHKKEKVRKAKSRKKV